MKIKTIDITAKEWFDKVNGNSYFSAQVTVNYTMPDEKTLYLPFQYGYGSHYETQAMQAMIKDGLIPAGNEMASASRYCRENNIVLRTNKYENCKQREVKAFGFN